MNLGDHLSDLRFDQEKHIEATKEYARQSLEYSLKGQKIGSEFAQLGLKLGFYANGGAILAVLSLIGSKNFESKIAISNFVLPFVIYTFGLCAIFISIFFAYLNFNFHSILRTDPGALCNTILGDFSKGWPYDYKASKKIQWSLYLGAGFAILSLILFAIGCFVLACKFLHLG